MSKVKVTYVIEFISNNFFPNSPLFYIFPFPSVMSVQRQPTTESKPSNRHLFVDGGENRESQVVK